MGVPLLDISTYLSRFPFFPTSTLSKLFFPTNSSSAHSHLFAMAFSGVGQGIGTYDRTEQTSGASLGRVTSRAHFTDVHPNDDLPAQTGEHCARDVGHLARQLTRQSVAAADDSAAIFSYQEGSDLDPFSEKFNAKKWTKLMFEASQSSGPGRKAGLSFRNLDVHGFGSDAGKSYPSIHAMARHDKTSTKCLQTTKRPSVTSHSSVSALSEI